MISGLRPIRRQFSQMSMTLSTKNLHTSLAVILTNYLLPRLRTLVLLLILLNRFGRVLHLVSAASKSRLVEEAGLSPRCSTRRPSRGGALRIANLFDNIDWRNVALNSALADDLRRTLVPGSGNGAFLSW